MRYFGWRVKKEGKKVRDDEFVFSFPIGLLAEMMAANFVLALSDLASSFQLFLDYYYDFLFCSSNILDI